MKRSSIPQNGKLPSAFTLIELLVVIVIIAVLAGIALPMISGAKESGNSAKCTSNLREIGAALNLYANDNNNNFPPITVASGSGNQDWTSYAITPYLPGRPTGATVQANTVFICPSAKYTGYATSNLSSTYSVTDCMASSSASGYSPTIANSRTALSSFSSSLLLFDACQNATNSSCAVNTSWADVSGSNDLKGTGTTSMYIDFRHRNAFHGLYADGHVDTITRLAAPTAITIANWRSGNQTDQ